MILKILRLKSGEDIIGMVDVETQDQRGSLTIQDPMTVDIELRGKQPGLAMAHWLPVQLIKENKTVINLSDVLTMIEPNEMFAEYYVNTVEKINQMLSAQAKADSMTDEEINDFMEALEDLSNQTIH